MARCAVIDQNNIVINIIMANPHTDPAPEGMTLVETDTAGPGWVWNGFDFIDPRPAPDPVPVTVPRSITRRQCALELHARGIITLEEALAMTKSGEVPLAIKSIFARMPDGERVMAEIDFAATNYYRNNFLLGKMGLTDPQIDQFFIAAAQL